MPPLFRVPRCHGPRVLTGFTLNGYEALFLENEKVRAAIGVGRGSVIQELTYKPRDLDILFKPPQGHLHHTGFIPTSHDERTYFDHHAGGWFECFPSGGPAVEYHGGRLGFHGELWGTPFAVEALEEDEHGCAVKLAGHTHRTPFKVEKTFALNGAALTIDEAVTNLGADDLEVLWGQHPTFGAPFVDPQAYVECAAKSYLESADAREPKPWPQGPLADEDVRRVRPRESRQGKMCFLGELTDGRARLVSPSWKLAFEIGWDAARFPVVWYYENAGSPGLPWFGRAYCVALEPFTGIGWKRPGEKQTLTIPAGQTIKAHWTGRFVET
ncbi:MAG: DUF4432 family protein [Planctomycetota bacterium]|nr:DUF4432 family protein [Planctomycetota bacterium]